MESSCITGTQERQLLTDALLELLPSLPTSAADSLADGCFLRKYQPGDHVIREGRSSEGVFLLISGKVEPSMADAALVQRRLNLLPISAPGMLAISSSMLEQPSPVSICASTPVQAGIISRRQFLNVLKQFPQAGLELSSLNGRPTTSAPR